MGVLKNIIQQRVYPQILSMHNPDFIPYSFGNVKKLAVTTFNLAMSPVTQPYMQVFIPANTWAINKYLIVRYYVYVLWNGLGPAGPNTVVDSYKFQTYLTATQNTSTWNQPLIASIDNVNERRFFLDDTGTVNITHGTDYLNKDYTLNSAIAPFNSLFNPTHVYDPTQDAALVFQWSSSNPGPGDVIQIKNAEAFIESPLDLGRLPR